MVSSECKTPNTHFPDIWSCLTLDPSCILTPSLKCIYQSIWYKIIKCTFCPYLFFENESPSTKCNKNSVIPSFQNRYNLKKEEENTLSFPRKFFVWNWILLKLSRNDNIMKPWLMFLWTTFILVFSWIHQDYILKKSKLLPRSDNFMDPPLFPIFEF